MSAEPRPGVGAGLRAPSRPPPPPSSALRSAVRPRERAPGAGRGRAGRPAGQGRGGRRAGGRRRSGPPPTAARRGDVSAMARSLCAGAWLRKPHYLQVGRPRPRYAPSSVPLRPASRSSPPPSPGAAPALRPSESRLGSLCVLHLCSGGPQPCHPRLRVSGSKTWCVIPPYFRESCVTSRYASGSPSPRQPLRLGAEPLGLLFPPQR